MLAQSFKRRAFASPLSSSRRCYSVLGRSAVCPSPSRGPRFSKAGGRALTATLVLGLGYSLYADADAPPPPREHAPTPLQKLLTSYAVHSMFSIPGLVDASPALLALCTSIPGLRQLTEAFVRITFFSQVCFLLLLNMVDLGLTLRNATRLVCRR